MKKKIQLYCPAQGIILVFFLSSFSTILHAQSDILTFIRKIKVDHQGTAGACDGSAFSTKGDIIAASDNTGLTKLFKVEDGSLISVIKHSEGEVSAAQGETNVIHFSPDDKYAVTGMDKTGAKIWDVKTGEMIKSLGYGQNTDGAAFSPNDKWIAVAHNRLLAVYTLWDYKKVAEFSVPKWEVNAVDWAEDASFLALGGDGSGVQIIRTEDWELLHNITFPTDRVKSVAISPDSKLAAACGQNGIVRVYNTSDGELVANLKHNTTTARALPGDDDDGDEPNVEAIEWSTDSKYLITGGTYDGMLRVFRVADWSLVGWVQGQEYGRQVETLSINQDNILASGGDEGYIYLFQFNPPFEKKMIQQDSAKPIIIEAEDFDANVPQGCHWWSVIDDATASGNKKVQCFPDLSKDSKGVITEYATNDPRTDVPKLDYRVNFSTPGVYHIWGRGFSYDHWGNSVHIGMNGDSLATADKLKFLGEDYGRWIWDKRTKDNAPASIEIKKAGPVTINIWPREDGIQLDKLILTLDESYTPKELGPKATERE
jgi:WD40 repeat protein